MDMNSFVYIRMNDLQIGLMRGGILLAEEPPLALMEKYNADSLETVFLKLSAKQETDENTVCEMQTMTNYISSKPFVCLN